MYAVIIGRQRKTIGIKGESVLPGTVLMIKTGRGESLPAGRLPRTQQPLLLVLVLCVAVLLVYGQTYSFDFTRYDDNYFVTDNPVVQQGLSVENVLWAFTAVQNGTWQPITWLTHMVDCQLFGLNAGGHHLTNVLFHMLSTVLLFLLLRRITSAEIPSAVVAALFALHPLHVESVAWVGERRDVLMAMWWLLTIFCHATWVEKGGTLRYLLILACFAAGLMSKPMLVSLPLILVLIDIWPLQRLPPPSSWSSWWQKKYLFLLVEKIPLVAMAAGMSVITMIAVGQEGSLGTTLQYPWVFRIENALVTYVKYLLFTLWPVGLIPHYPYPPSYPLWQVAASCVILAAITFYSIRNLGKRPYLAVGWLWYLISMFPVIGLVQQGSGFSMADRYSYVPLIGIFMMLAWEGKQIVERYNWPRAVVSLALTSLLALYTVLSFIQTGHWRNTETLFTYTLDQSPGNHVALQQLGVEYRERGEFAKAYPLLAEDVRLNPQDVDALANFGQLLERMGRLKEAIDYHQKAITINPYNDELILNLGQIQARSGDLPGAHASFSRVLELNPHLLPAQLNLGFTLYLEKKFDEASALFDLVLQQAPQTAEAYNGLGLVALEQGRLDAASSYFRKALMLNPALPHVSDSLRAIEERRKVRE